MIWKIISVLFIANGAMAGVNDLAILANELKVKNNQVATDLKLAKQQAEAAKKSVESLRKEYEAAKTDWETSAGGIGGFKSGSGDREFKKNMDAAKSKLDMAEKSAAQLDAQVEQLNNLSTNLVQESEKNDGEIENINRAFAAALKSQGLISDFNILKGKIGSIDDTLDRMSTEYDKALLGAYIKDKIGLLLNSNLMCEAAKRCKSLEPTKIQNDKIEQVLFPGTSNSTRKQDYYEKVNKTGAVK